MIQRSKRLRAELKKARKRRERRKAHARRQLQFEALEDRIVLSAVTVTNTNDDMNGDTSSITALIADQGSGDIDGISLREAIEAANNTSGADEIDFDASLADSTIMLGGTQLELTDDVTITGLGADDLTVSGNNGSRVFQVDIGVTAELADLTITGGALSGDGGGIFNAGTLTVTDSNVTGNRASRGGGIWNSSDGMLMVMGSTIDGNTASASGGAIYNEADGTVTVSSSTLSGNSAENTDGGGILNLATLIVTDGTIIENNSADARGGGIGNFSAGTVEVTDSTVNDNVAVFGGGGIFNSSGGTLDVTGSTISGNMATDTTAIGGGIGNQGMLTVTSTTISGNSAESRGGGIYNENSMALGTSSTIDIGDINNNSASFGAGIYNENEGSLALTGGSVDGNTATQCGGGIFNAGILTVDETTISDNTASEDGGGVFNNGNGSLEITNGMFSNNSTVDGSGGGIWSSGTLDVTGSIISGNSASGSGDGGGIWSSGTLDVTGSTIDGNTANSNGGGILNENSVLNVTDSIITGNFALRGGGIETVADYGSTATTTLDHAVVSNNRARTDGGGLSVFGLGDATMSIDTSEVRSNNISENSGTHRGGGIFNLGGDLTVTQSTIDDNAITLTSGVALGGGIYNLGTGITVTITDSTISNNEAVGVTTTGTVARGGGIRNLGATNSGVDLSITNSTIAGNRVKAGGEAQGGGIANFANNAAVLATITNATIADNMAVGATTTTIEGGGIHNEVGQSSPSLEISPKNTIVARNSTSSNGSGPDVFGDFNSLGYNLIGIDDGSTGFTGTGDQVGTSGTPIDPHLDTTLQNNGGPTETLALLSDSPAIDAADTGSLTTDQRGFARPVDISSIPNASGGNGGDIGAYELPPPPVYDFTQSTFSSPEGDATNITNLVMVTRSGNTSIASSVDVVLAGNTATAGTDFTAGAVTLNFAIGETTKEVPLELLGELIVEDDETIDLSFDNFSDSGQAGTTNPASTFTIENDDSATLSIDDVSLAEGTGGVTTMTFTAQLTGEVEDGFDVDFASALVDAEAGDLSVTTTSPLHFDGTLNEAEMIDVDITTDAIVENDESFTITLGTVSNTSAEQIANITSGDSATGTIENDDAETSVQLSGNDLLITDINGTQNTNDDLTFSVSGGNLIITVAQPLHIIDIVGGLEMTTGVSGDLTTAVAVPLTAFTGNVIVDSLAGDDVLRFDSTFDIGVSRGLVVKGGMDNDEIFWDATAMFDSLDWTAETIHLDSGIVTTTGNQAYTGGIEVGADNALSAVDVTFDATIDSDATAHDLMLNNSGDLEFNKEVGGISVLKSIEVTSTGSTVDINAAVNVGGGGFNIDPPDTINLNSSITTSGGDVTLTAATDVIGGGAIETSGGAIAIDAMNGEIALSLIDSSNSSGDGGDISLDAATDITITGFPGIQSLGSGADDGGNISVSAASGSFNAPLVAADGGASGVGGMITVNAGADIITTLMGSVGGQGGTIELTADAIQFEDIRTMGFLANGGDVTMDAATSIDGTGEIKTTTSSSNLTDHAGEIMLLSGGTIGMADAPSLIGLAVNSGTGSDITVQSDGNVNLSEVLSGDSSSSTSGAGGSISVSSANGSITAERIDSTSDADNGGDVTLGAATDVTITSLTVFSEIVSFGGGVGDGGDILVSAGSSTTPGSFDAPWVVADGGSGGTGGAINVTASANISTTLMGSVGNQGGTITLIGDSIQFGDIRTSSNTGSGGDVTINADTSINGSGEIDASTSSTSPTAQGGQIMLMSGGTIGAVNGPDLVSYAVNNGIGGDITVQSDGNVNLSEVLSGDSLSSTSGAGGSISVSSANGSITAERIDSTSDADNGGDVTLGAATDVTITSSTVFSEIVSFGGGSGDGGDISVSAGSSTTPGSFDAPWVVADGGSGGTGGAINVNASGSINTSLVGSVGGDGGTVSLTADSISFGDIRTLTNSGSGGDVTITAVTDIDGGGIHTGGQTGGGLITLIGPGEISGVIEGNGDVVKDGPAVLTFSAVNTYSGTTTVADGMLALSHTSNNNIDASAAIDIDFGATLDVTDLPDSRLDLADGQALQGEGTVNGSVTALDGSLVTPGSSAGILMVDGDLNFESGSETTFELGGATPGNGAGFHDQVAVTIGSVTIDTGSTLNVATIGGFAPSGSDTFTIIDNDGDPNTDPIVGHFAGLPENSVITVGPYNFVITYEGGDGNDVMLTANRPPVADAGGPYTIGEGSDLQLDASASFDPDPGDSIVSYEWDLDDDGQYDDFTTTSAVDTVPWSTLFALGIDDGPLTGLQISVLATDQFGETDESDPADLTLENVPPTVTPAGGQSVSEGGLLALNVASFVDPAVLDTHTASIDWGDGSTVDIGTVSESNGSGTVSGSHVYADDGVYTTTVRVADDDMSGDFTSGTDGVDFVEQTFQVTVANEAPTIDDASLTNTSPECGDSHSGDAITVSVDFSDPGFDNPAGGTSEHFLLSEIDWGDGTVQTVSSTPALSVIETDGSPGTDTLGSIEGTHIYADGGVYTVTVTVRDDDGGFDEIQTTVVTTGVGVVGNTLYVIGTEGEDKVDVKLKGSDGDPDQTINVKGKFDKKGSKEKFDEDFSTSNSSINNIVIVLCGSDDDAHVHKDIALDALIDGGEGDDKLKGGSGNDTILGGGGEDDLKGYDGDDLLDGGDQGDKLNGGKGNDILLGGSGADDLKGGSDGGSDGGGDDILSGGDGDDKLKAGKGMNILIGGDGEDDIKGGGSDNGGDLFVGGYTSHDDDPSKLAEMRDIWTSGDPYGDIVNELSGVGGLLEVGVSVFGDDDEDKLEGHKKSLDLFFAEMGLDELKGEEDDTVVPL